jgi:hypothetical protein
MSGNHMAIRQAAEKLITRYGRDAPRQARMRADELHEAGDKEACQMWRAIHETAVALLKDSPESGSRH